MKMTPCRNLPFFCAAALPTMTALAALAPFLVPCPAAAAAKVEEQGAPPRADTAAGAARDLRALLETVRYDPGERGPLLVVLPSRAATSAPAAPDAAPRSSLGLLAESEGYIVVPVGGITAVVPGRMTVIVTKPARVNPYAGMQRGHLARLLMASLTGAQWAELSDETGIGPGSLNAEQRLMFDRLLPPRPEVVKRTTDRDPATGRGVPRVISRTPLALDRHSLRLRISRRVDFFFPSGPTTSHGNDAFRYPAIGEVVAVLEPGVPTDGVAPEDPDDPLSPEAYGQTILKTVPNRSKPSDLDFRSARFEGRIPLTPAPDPAGKSVTLGDLVARVAAASKVDLVADSRIRDLEIYSRGTTARAGDILEALCRGVTGAFRRVGATQTFVLTDDREGIGTRYGRLAEWADDAEAAATALLAQADAGLKKSNAMANLRFLPGDPLTPSAAQTALVESGWKKGEWAPLLPLSDLSEPLQRAAKRTLDQFGDATIQDFGIQSDRVRLTVGMRAAWIVPEIGALADHDLIGMGPSLGDFVEREPGVAPPAAPASVPLPNAPATAATAAIATARPKRTVLLARVDSGEQAASILTAARRHGFGEVWFQVRLDDADGAAGLLAVAARAGQEQKIAVGASVDLLRGTGLPGEEERNILGETGAAFLRRHGERGGPAARNLRGYEGWIAPDRDGIEQIASRAARIAAVPGLAGIAVRAWAAPGRARLPEDRNNTHPHYLDGLPSNGRLGYTDTMRAAYLREKGIDPIDIPELGTLRRVFSLPFFPNTTDTWNGRVGPSQGRDPNRKDALSDWREFRSRRSEETVTALHKALRSLNPTIPLLLDDGVSSYTPDIWGSWFVRWDGQVPLPRNKAHFPRKERLQQARASGAREVLSRTGFGEDSTKPDTREQFVARTQESVAYAVSENWDGIVIDLSGHPPAEVLKRLEMLPHAAP